MCSLHSVALRSSFGWGKHGNVLEKHRRIPVDAPPSLGKRILDVWPPYFIAVTTATIPEDIFLISFLLSTIQVVIYNE